MSFVYGVTRWLYYTVPVTQCIQGDILHDQLQIWERITTVNAMYAVRILPLMLRFLVPVQTSAHAQRLAASEQYEGVSPNFHQLTCDYWVEKRPDSCN